MEEGEPGIYCGIFSFIVCGGGIYDVCLFRVGILLLTASPLVTYADFVYSKLFSWKNCTNKR